MGSRAHENSPGVPMSLESYESNRKPANNENAFNGNVENMEDDGNGFFITGINTKGGPKVVESDAKQPDLEEPVIDPFDSYKHIAVVDCSKAFSNQEVSTHTSF